MISSHRQHPTFFIFIFLEGQTSYPKHIHSNNPVISSLSHYEWFTADGTKTDAQFSVWWWYYPQGVERKVGRNIFRRVQRIDSSVWLYVWTLAFWLIICAKTKLWIGLALFVSKFLLSTFLLLTTWFPRSFRFCLMFRGDLISSMSFNCWLSHGEEKWLDGVGCHLGFIWMIFVSSVRRKLIHLFLISIHLILYFYTFIIWRWQRQFFYYYYLFLSPSSFRKIDVSIPWECRREI